MNELFENIKIANHIEIRVLNPLYMCGANALYTYILTQHKKVSLYQDKDDLDNKYRFLPWFSKIKTTVTPSADISLDFDYSALELYDFFKKYDIKINRKIATSLYAAFVEESDGFSKDLDGTIFAICSLLIQDGANHREAIDNLIKNISLAQLRLKADMLLEMKLKNNATLAEFRLSEEMLQRSGATIEMAKKNINEAFLLRYVESVHLIYENKIIKKIDKERSFGKKK